jgi:glutathione peroxidase
MRTLRTAKPSTKLIFGLIGNLIQRSFFVYCNFIPVFMKYIYCLLFLICQTVLFAQDTLRPKEYSVTTIYQFKVKDINGNEFDMGCLEGKKVMIVNTASKCMYGPQLYDLQKLYEKYKDQNFVIIAFPSNSFANREPGNNKEIAWKYKKKYKIEFPLMAKVETRNENMHPLFDYLTSKVQNGINDKPVQWNFQKYLINEEGFLVKIIEPKIKPFDKVITGWIEEKE